MLRQISVILIIGLVMNVSVSFAQTQNEKDIKRTAKVKAEVAKRGTGTKAKIKLELKDKTVIKGYISEIKPDSFVVVNAKDGISSEIRYEQVRRANVSSNTLAIIGIAAGIATIIGLVVAGRQ